MLEGFAHSEVVVARARKEARLHVFAVFEVADVFGWVPVVSYGIVELMQIGLFLYLILQMQDPLRGDAHEIDVDEEAQQQSQHDLEDYCQGVAFELT